jgi:hypothetical protein
MPAVKGKGCGGKRAGSGRKKGVGNLLTQEVKDMVKAALAENGGVEYLSRIAKTDPRTFCAMVGKLIPTAVEGTGEDGAITFTVVTGVPEPIAKPNGKANGRASSH